MREILFRGQTRRYGEKVRMGDGEKLPSRWVYGGVLQGIGDFSIIYGGEKPDDPSDGLDKCVVYTDTLGQYTGLTDKNGKRIFDGDIIHTDRNGGRTYFVLFDADLCAFVGLAYESNIFTTFEGDGDRYEVIGNIHDNPELLKEAET